MPHPELDATSPADLLAERAPDWLAAVARRCSRRAYDRTPVAPELLDALEDLAERFRPYADVRTELVRDPDPGAFTGIVGSYGKVTGAPHLLAFIGDSEAPFTDQHVGYAGEAIVLEATRLGLDTCWVGGFFSAAKVASSISLAPGERIYAVTPVGRATTDPSMAERAMRGMAGAHRRKPLAEIAPGLSDEWPAWAVAAVETARLAPSAVNRQPWRFRYEPGTLALDMDRSLETPKVAKRLDCGIAALHAELGAIVSGVRGTWSDLTGREVARYETGELT